jgi:hypothetical protein
MSTLAITPNRLIPLNPAEALKKPMAIYLFNTVFNPDLALIISFADCYTNMGSIPLQIWGFCSYRFLADHSFGSGWKGKNITQ